MPIRVWLVLACLWFSGSASAAMVELVFDVLVNQRNVAELDDGQQLYWPDSSFSPQAFALTARFDLDDPHMSRAYGTGNTQVSAVFRYDSTSTSATPFTGTFLAALPELSGPLATQVNTWRIADWQADTSNSNFVINTNFYDYAGSDDGYVYQRGLFFARNEAGASLDGFDPWVGQSLLDWLTLEIGHTFAGAFSESYARWVREPQFDANGVYLGSETLAYEGVILKGDLTLRSVTVVPLPAVGLALPLLLGMGFVAKRYRCRGVRQ